MEENNETELVKYGNITDKTPSDFNLTKKAEFYDEDGYCIASKDDKDKLSKPKKLK